MHSKPILDLVNIIFVLKKRLINFVTRYDLLFLSNAGLDLIFYSQGLAGMIYYYTCAISAYHHLRCQFESCSRRGVLDTTLSDKVCQ
jgi:hypothetical protein